MFLTWATVSGAMNSPRTCFTTKPSGQWRGWTTGFSALGTKSQKEEKAILAVWSDRDPRQGFSIMHARPIGLQGQHEDPHGVYDSQADKWRLLLSERAEKYRAGMWESDDWDRGYQRLAGPVEMDSTGTLIQTDWQVTLCFLRKCRSQSLHSLLSRSEAGWRIEHAPASVEREHGHAHLAKHHTAARWVPCAVPRADDGSPKLSGYAGSQLDVRCHVPLLRPSLRLQIPRQSRTISRFSRRRRERTGGDRRGWSRANGGLLRRRA